MARVVADGRGAGFVLADRHQRTAKRRSDDPACADEDQQEQHRDKTIEGTGIGQGQQHGVAHTNFRARHAEQAVVAAGPVAQGVGDEVRHLAERQREHHEVNARAPNRQGAHQQRQETTGNRRAEQRGEQAQLQVDHQQRRTISTGTKEDALAEGQQPGVAQQQVAGQGGHGKDQDLGSQGRRGQHQRQADQHGQHPQQHGSGLGLGKRQRVFIAHVRLSRTGHKGVPESPRPWRRRSSGSHPGARVWSSGFAPRPPANRRPAHR